MTLLRCLSYLTLFHILFSCTGGRAEIEEPAEPTLQITHQVMDDRSYWAWEGKEPMLLLGASSRDNLFQSQAFETELKQLAEAGGNFISINLHSDNEGDALPYAKNKTGSKFDYRRPVKAYWGRLKELVTLAERLRIVVQIYGGEGEEYGWTENSLGRFREKFFDQLLTTIENNHNVLLSLDGSKSADQLSHAEYALIDGYVVFPKGWKANHTLDPAVDTEIGLYQEGFIDDSRIAPATSNQERWQWVLKARDSISQHQMLHATSVTGHGPNPTIVDGTTQFNQALLAGYAAANHAPEPLGNGFSGAALSSIRTVRNIEQSIKFWDLNPAPEIILGETTPGLCYPAKDAEDNYLIYISGPGKVKVRLATEDQRRLRVTVIGYLGTRRSEILEPPYGPTFELTAEDDRGAWLLMKGEE